MEDEHGRAKAILNDTLVSVSALVKLLKARARAPGKLSDAPSPIFSAAWVRPGMNKVEHKRRVNAQ
jgi:hypothetical protein